MIDTMALANKIARWNTELSTAPIRIKADLDEELRPLLSELANLRGELLATKIARDLAVTVDRAKAYDEGFKAGMAASTATAMPASGDKDPPELDPTF